MKVLVTAAMLAALAAPALANQSSTRAHLANTLPQWGYADVDVNALSSVQVAHITHLLHSNKSPSQIRGNIGAILGDSLISTLFDRK